MRLPSIPVFLVAVCAISAAGTAGAGTLIVSVSDRDGVELQDVVITVDPVEVDTLPEAKEPGNVLIDQRRRKFRPWVVGIRTGATVTFDNHDDITHHVYSFSQPKQFSFRLQAGVAHDPIRFDRPGTVVIGCNIHDWMVGFIVITQSPFISVSDEQGRVNVGGVAPGEWRVSAWHPGLEAGEQGPEQIVSVTAGVRQSVELRFETELALRKPPDPPLDELIY